jgi:organic hydroperoxide reductase OsmC/OhrA
VEVTTHRARVVWEGGKDDLRAHRVELGEQMLAGSTMAANGGDGSKADPEGLLVGARSSCQSGDRFTNVVLRPSVEWIGEKPDARTVASFHHKAHEACYIANSVNFPVEVEIS